MADWYDHIDDERRGFIERQHIFFVSTAPDDLANEWPNLSPKGRTLVRVLGPNLIGWLDYPGSGNQTAVHTAQNGKVTVMFCSFEATAGILRVFGRGRAAQLDDPDLVQYREAFRDDLHPYVRQVFLVEVDKLQTSCGYAVPKYDYRSDRDTLDKYCDRHTEPREMVDGWPVAGPFRAKVRA